MSIQTIELVRTRSGFRLALNAKKFRMKNNHFKTLEVVLKNILDQIAITPKNEWDTLLSNEKIQSFLPEIGDRIGDLSFRPIKVDEEEQIIVARCSISFMYWRKGGWVAYSGIRIQNGIMTILTDGELSKWW